jgi:FlaA1/EpsC-like NDP-sugar epimerase
MVQIRRRELLLLPLVIATAISLVAAFLLRFDFVLGAREQSLLRRELLVFVLIKAVVFYVFGLHRIAWRLVGVFDLLRAMLANLCASILAVIVAVAVVGPQIPISVYIVDGLLCFLLTAGIPVCVRLHRDMTISGTHRKRDRKNLLIYGAGAAGLTLAREIRSNGKLATKVVGFLDDDPKKLYTSFVGIPILGAGRDAARLVMHSNRRHKPISEIVIAMPSATGRQMRAAIANCRAAGIPFKTVPGLGELLEGKVLSGQIRDVSVTDLLGREPVNIDEPRISESIAGHSVMVTGGCGSIGSELCRQLARFGPRKIVILDQAESPMFMLAMELRGVYPNLDLVTEIGDICRERRVEEVITRHAIDTIYHAAAYKHVPMMEESVFEAAENNIIGTLNVLTAAERNGVRNFVQISSDKAVNPSSIMGVTKRIAELLVAGSRTYGNTYVSVRFGNVLASAGSVVQIFQRQIASGGPVTVTHPDMRRYFMSIPEAVQLVLQASTMGKGSEIFVLDMGEPVHVVELARNMIRLAGMVPDEDIEIHYTGLRRGEKLFEELRLDTEDILPTHHEKINIFRSATPTQESLQRWMGDLQRILDERNELALRRHLKVLVPEYQANPRLELEKTAALTAV